MTIRFTSVSKLFRRLKELAEQVYESVYFQTAENMR